LRRDPIGSGLIPRRYISLGDLNLEFELKQGAIEQIPREQQTDLVSWLSERDWNASDDRIERDFPAGCRGVQVLTDLEREIAEGQSLPMEEGLAEQRKLRP